MNKIRLACYVCDRRDCDGRQAIPQDWHDVIRIRSLKESQALAGEWYTHLGTCPDCEEKTRSNDYKN